MYKKDRYEITCKHCSKTHKTGDARVQYCSIACYNTHTKTKGVDGYKPCEICKREMPYRNSLKVRSRGRVASIKTRFCSKKCLATWRNGEANPMKKAKARQAVSDKAKLRPVSHMHTPEASKKRRATISKDGHWNWKGGITPENKAARNRYEYKVWRSAVFTRDNYTCQMCGKRGGYLEADHILPWAYYPELRYDLENGRTLCKPCHVTTDTYMGKALKHRPNA